MLEFAITDIHGRADLFFKALDIMSALDNSFHCFVLGDVADRGEDGYNLMKYFLSSTENFSYIKGNHEDLFVKAAINFLTEVDKEKIKKEDYINFLTRLYQSDRNGLISLYIHNGGMIVLSDWIHDGAPLDILSKLNALPQETEKTIAGKSFLFCHSGLIEGEYIDRLWWREPILEPSRGKIVVHGHTPVRVFMNDKTLSLEPLRYAEGTRINLDIGLENWNKMFIYDVSNDKFIPVEL